jgi:hypothetical protein
MSNEDYIYLHNIAPDANNYQHPKYFADSSGDTTFTSFKVNEYGHITWTGNHIIPTVTTVEDGLMTAQDKVDLEKLKNDKLEEASEEKRGLMSANDYVTLYNDNKRIGTLEAYHTADPYLHTKQEFENAELNSKAGFYKVYVDDTGHIVGRAKVTANDINSLVGSITDVASSTSNGLMSKENYIKLSKIDNNANYFTVADIPTASSTKLGLVKVKDRDEAVGYTNVYVDSDGFLHSVNTTYDVADGITAGLMSNQAYHSLFGTNNTFGSTDSTTVSNYSIVTGQYNNSNGKENVVIGGYGNTANADNQFILGEYADAQEDYLLVGGNGTKQANKNPVLSNAFYFDKNGNGEVKNFNVSERLTTNELTMKDTNGTYSDIKDLFVSEVTLKENKMNFVNANGVVATDKQLAVQEGVVNIKTLLKKTQNVIYGNSSIYSTNSGTYNINLNDFKVSNTYYVYSDYKDTTTTYYADRTNSESVTLPLEARNYFSLKHFTSTETYPDTAANSTFTTSLYSQEYYLILKVFSTPNTTSGTMRIIQELEVVLLPYKLGTTDYSEVYTTSKNTLMSKKYKRYGEYNVDEDEETWYEWKPDDGNFITPSNLQELGYKPSLGLLTNSLNATFTLGLVNDYIDTSKSATGYNMYNGFNYSEVTSTQKTNGDGLVCIQQGTFRPYKNGLMNLGTQFIAWNNIYSVNGAVSISDKKLKENISYEVLDKYMNLYEKLQTVSYKFRGDNHDRTHLGFIAQDIEKIAIEEEIDLNDLSLLCKEKISNIFEIGDDDESTLSTFVVPDSDRYTNMGMITFTYNNCDSYTINSLTITLKDKKAIKVNLADKIITSEGVTYSNENNTITINLSKKGDVLGIVFDETSSTDLSNAIITIDSNKEGIINIDFFEYNSEKENDIYNLVNFDLNDDVYGHDERYYQYSLRYTEFIPLMIEYEHRKTKELEDRISKLEDQINNK